MSIIHDHSESTFASHGMHLNPLEVSGTAYAPRAGRERHGHVFQKHEITYVAARGPPECWVRALTRAFYSMSGPA